MIQHRTHGLPEVELSSPFGFTVVETLRDKAGRDRAHDALEQAVSEASALAVQQAEECVVLPVVVTAAPLFIASFDAPARTELTAVGWHRIRWHGAQAFSMPTAVDIVQANSLPHYSRALQATLESVLERLGHEVPGQPWTGDSRP